MTYGVCSRLGGSAHFLRAGHRFRNNSGNIMQVNLLNVFTASERDYNIDYVLEQDFIVVDGRKKNLSEMINFKGTLTSLGKDDCKLVGKIKFSYETVCDRCTKDLNETVNVSIDKEINLVDTEEEFLEGSVLDLDKLIFEEIYLNLPVKTLCKDDCKGICSQCGADLNEGTCDCDDLSIDPRLAKLKDLFKEV